MERDANNYYYIIRGLSKGKYRVYEKSFSDDVKKLGYILDQTPYEFEVKSDGTIVYNNGTPSANITIPVTNERPDLTKTVKENGNDNYGQEAQYGVGDTVPYQITVTVPNNITKLKTFTVTDTPSHVKFKGLETVTYDDGTVNSSAYDLDTTNAGNGFILKFKPSEMGTYAGKTITINYTGVVQKTAETTVNGDTNEAKLDYTNKIDINGTPEPDGDTNRNYVEDHATVYMFSIKVEKIAGDTKQGLDDVEFDLYKKVKTGEQADGWTPVQDNEVKDLKLPDAGDDETWYKVNDTKLKTENGGFITVTGLSNGDYYLVETKTKEGYNLLNEPFKVELQIQATTTWTKETTYDGNGNVIKHETNQKTTEFTGSDDKASVIKTITIVNRKGFELPVTGGFGTLLFSGIGVLLVLAGVSVLFSLKKKNGRA